MATDVPMPARIAALPRDKTGRPIPWFVHVQDGVPDFRIVRVNGIPDAVRFELCWVCGQRRGRHAAFVVGPMCSVNRTSAEPPSHLDCATYSARACPFLANPEMRRRTTGIDTSAGGPHVEPPAMLTRNPGVALVWSSKSWGAFRVPADGGVLFDIGAPTATSWWAHGREATHEEVMDSITSGLPLLQAEAAEHGHLAEAQLRRDVARAMPLVPVP